jgi:hypothetical protein
LGHLKEIQDDAAAAIQKQMEPSGTLHGIDLKYFINMDQTAVYFEMKSNTTVHKIGARTVSVQESGSNSKRATIVLAVAADGTKLPPFVVFKGKNGVCLVVFNLLLTFCLIVYFIYRYARCSY